MQTIFGQIDKRLMIVDGQTNTDKCYYNLKFVEERTIFGLLDNQLMIVGDKQIRTNVITNFSLWTIFG